MKIFIAILSIIIVAAGIWCLTRPATDGTEIGDPPISVISPAPSPEASATPSQPAGMAVKAFVVTGSSFKFDPSEIRVKQGDVVAVTFVNSGGMHDFVLDEFNARTAVLQGGAQQVIQFTADKKGTFEYYCSVGNHRQMGMRGSLIVE